MITPNLIGSCMVMGYLIYNGYTSPLPITLGSTTITYTAMVGNIEVDLVGTTTSTANYSFRFCAIAPSQKSAYPTNYWNNYINTEKLISYYEQATIIYKP